MFEDVDVFILGYGDHKLQIPVFGLSGEMKSALKLSLVPLVVLATRDALLRTFSTSDIATFYAFVLLIMWTGYIFRGSATTTHCPLISQIISALVAATSLYFLMLILYNSLRILGESWVYFLWELFVLFFLIVYRDTFQVYSFFQWMTEVVTWLERRLVSFHFNEYFPCLRKGRMMRLGNESEEDYDDAHEVLRPPSRRHSILRLREDALRSMNQEIDTPPPVRFAPPLIARRKIIARSISPIRPIRSSHR